MPQDGESSVSAVKGWPIEVDGCEFLHDGDGVVESVIRGESVG